MVTSQHENSSLGRKQKKNKKIALLSVILVIAVVGIVVYFITRPQQQEEILPQKFAQLPEKPKLIAEFYYTDIPIQSVAFSPVDTVLIASVNSNATIKLWDINNTKEPIKILSHPGLFATIGFSPTGELLASLGSGKLILWDVASGTKINSIESTTNQFAFNPNGQQLATIPKRRNEKRLTEVRIWDIRNPEKISEIGNLPFNEAHKATGWPCAVDFSSNGKWIAAGYSNGTINVWNLQTRKLVKNLESALHQMDNLKFSPNNKYMVANGRDPEAYSNSSVKGYIMWELSSWQRKGEVLRGNVDNLVFSPDGRLCTSATDRRIYGRGVEIWSTTNGAPITTIPTEARDVSFSHDGDLIVTGGNDGMVRVWKLTQAHLDFTNVQNDLVRLIYNLPKGIDPSTNITEKIDKTIRQVQKFYADEMERHGFGRKTFSFETDENGRAKIYRMEGHLTEYHDLQLNDLWLVFVDDMKDAATLLIDNILEQNTSGQNKGLFDTYDSTFTYPTKRNTIEKGKIYMDNIEGFTGDGRFISISKKKLDWKLTAYSLKRLFGVLGPEHSWDKYGPNMPNKILNSFDRLIPWSKDWVTLSKCEAEFLDKSRYFNPNQSFFDNQPEIEMSIFNADTASQLFQLTATDEDGINQLLLFVPDNLEYQHRINKLQGCESINGKKRAIVEFEVFNTEIKRGEIRMIDMLGNIAAREFRITE